MIRYILKRIFSVIPVLFVVAVAVFLLIRLSPGDPALVILGSDATPESVDQLREKLGLTLPLYQQFVIWFLGMLKGDLGNSIFFNQPVVEVILSHLGPTLSLAIFAQIIAILVAIPIGILASTHRNSLLDQSVMGFSLLGISVPSFLLGLFLILIVSVNLGWFPVAGYQPMSSGIWNHLYLLTLPAIALGYMMVGLIARMTRASMLDVLNNGYIKTARSKGLNEKVVTYKHALRNASITILESVGQTFTILIGGTVVIETVFNIPGIGHLIINAIERRDFPLIQGIVLYSAAAHVFINLVVDLLYGVVDPRVRLNK